MDNFGELVQFTIPRHGDLFDRIWQVQILPKINLQPQTIQTLQTLFAKCSIVITEDELSLLPDDIADECRKNRDNIERNSFFRWIRL